MTIDEEIFTIGTHKISSDGAVMAYGYYDVISLDTDDMSNLYITINY